MLALIPFFFVQGLFGPALPRWKASKEDGSWGVDQQVLMDTSTINSWDKPPSNTAEHLEGKVWKMMLLFRVLILRQKKKGKWCTSICFGWKRWHNSHALVSKLTFSGVVQNLLLDPNDQSRYHPCWPFVVNRCFALKEVPIGYLGAVLLAWEKTPLIHSATLKTHGPWHQSKDNP